MASSPVSPQLEQLGDRRFSFYPPIVGIEHNEWVFCESNWSEIQVRNAKTEAELWIPRAYVGEVSKVEEPVMIVGLKRELELKGGLLGPYARRVLTMPANPMVSATRSAAASSESLPPVASGLSVKSALRGNGGTEGRMGKLILLALAAGLLLTFVGVAFLRQRTTGGPVEFQGVLQLDLGLTFQSDYFDVVRKLGPPAADRWRADAGERQYRALEYPKRDLIVVLMGADRDSATYIGAKDSKWRTVHAVEQPGGGRSNTEPILRTLTRF